MLEDVTALGAELERLARGTKPEHSRLSAFRFSPATEIAKRFNGGPNAAARCFCLSLVTAITISSSPGFAQSGLPHGVKTLSPPAAIKSEGTWSLGARAGDFIFVAGMQGRGARSCSLVSDPILVVPALFSKLPWEDQRWIDSCARSR